MDYSSYTVVIFPVQMCSIGVNSGKGEEGRMRGHVIHILPGVCPLGNPVSNDGFEA